MSCCCPAPKNSPNGDGTTKATKGSGIEVAAPGKESMNRDSTSTGGIQSGGLASKMDDDTRAVDWWRHHQQDSQNGFHNVSRKELDEAIPTSAATALAVTPTMSSSSSSSPSMSPTASPSLEELKRQQQLERSQGRMQDRNPLEKPYEISRRELPVRPVNGNILKPNYLPKETLNTMSPSSSSATTTVSSLGTGLKRERSSAINGTTMEIFEAEHIKYTGVSESNTTVLSEPNMTMEHMSIIAKVDSTDQSSAADQTTATTTTIRSGPAVTPPRLDKIDRGNNVISQADMDTHRQRRKLPLSKFIEKKSQQPVSSLGARYLTEESDHLSDVPSEVDSVIRERYLLACHMLKTSMMQKDKSLIPIEREFILSLLGDFDTDGVDSVVSAEQVSEIERAALRLEHDPAFQYPVIKKTFSSESTASMPNSSTSGPIKQVQRKTQQTQRKVDTVSPRVEIGVRSGKNPHTATRTPTARGFVKNMTSACNPLSERDMEVSDSIIRMNDEVIIDEGEVLLDNDDSHDDEDPNLMHRKNYDDNGLVRFDGWSFQESSEYPFLILGAAGEHLSPRVMTPAMMEALRGFMPYGVSESNFWLKFSLVRDGASLATLLATVRASTYTLIGVETNHGEVFGCFTGTPWRIGTKWFGTGEAFLWRLKRPRLTTPKNSKKPNFENEMEVYPFTGYDNLVQYCTPKTIAVGGGDWLDNPCPFEGETKGIGFMIDGDLAGGETNSCATFASPRLAKNTTASNEFTISNIEAWTLTPCINVKDAAKLEMQKLFLEEHSVLAR